MRAARADDTFPGRVQLTLRSAAARAPHTAHVSICAQAKALVYGNGVWRRGDHPQECSVAQYVVAVWLYDAFTV